MKRFSILFRLPIFLIFFMAPIACTTEAQGQRYLGDLGPDDATFNSGEYYDVYEFEVEAGQQIEARLTSTAFDTYLILTSPSEDNTVNDDYEGSSTESGAVLTATESGLWKVVVTSHAGAETGAYELVVKIVGDPAPMADVRVEYGLLEDGDATLNTGEYADTYDLEGEEGERVTLSLEASDFDPYLIFRRPNGEQYDNDDHEGSASRSLLALDLPETGTYSILVTSYKPGMEGAYTLTVTQDAQLAQGPAPRTEQGRLEDGDRTLRSGEYMDTYTFEGRPGQHLSLDVQASDFDTFLLLKTPGGEQHENDDADDLPGHSVIDMDLSEAGSYTIGVTSYAVGETGDYELVIDLQAAQEIPNRQHDVSAITMSEQVSGQLEDGDLHLETGEYQDLYVFEGNAQDNVRIEMASPDFDTYLSLITPSGDVISNDDYEGNASVSRIETALPVSGRYRIVTTSYASGEMGRYTLALREGSLEAVDSRGGTGRIYGLFVGISDYGGRVNDLQYTAADATLIRDALVRGGMRPEDGIVLTDAEATTGQFRNSLDTIAQRAGPDDLFVLFFSGHGGRYERAAAQPSDPDAMDESLEFYDAEILDDALSTLLDEVGAGTQLLVMDACFSGGFSKDVISKPGRMGMFSSEEDVTSSVAAKFRAGGFLSQFFADAVGEGLADEDEDGTITAIELSQYIYERYRGEVKSGGRDDVVVTSSRQLGYQKLVVDRGSIRPYNTLFYRQ